MNADERRCCGEVEGCVGGLWSIKKGAKTRRRFAQEREKITTVTQRHRKEYRRG
jgi:hypothetical protein